MPLTDERSAFDGLRNEAGANVRLGEASAAVLDVDVLSSLEALERDQGATRPTTLLAAYTALLHRYAGQDELAVAVFEGDRRLRLRLDLSADPSFRDLVAQVNKVWRDTGTDSDAPGGDPVDATFAYCPASALPLAVDTRPEFGLLATETAAGVRVSLESASRHLEARHVLAHFTTLLRSLVQQPEHSVSSAAVLPAAERAQLLVGLNETASNYPSVALPELVAATAARGPDRPAVTSAERTLSYGELERRSGHLAGYLRARGAGRGSLVGVCLERSVDLLVAVLGVLKAGAAYVPVDPNFPAARQAHMLEDSAAPVVITQSSLLASLPAGGYETVCIDADWSRVERAPVTAAPVEADELAYVIYTSGSTGRPKGVEITHRSLVNFLWAMRDRPGLQAGDVLVAVTTLSFDIAGLELFLPLVVGAQTVIATSAELLDPAALAGLIDRTGATVLQATPLRWRMLVESGWAPRGGLKGLCGGEALPARLAGQLTALGVELWNMYGPTETTIWSTCARIRPGDEVTVGRPIANTTVFVLDRHREPVPLGAVGELWIGGDGVARGYHNRPDLTAERFVEHGGERIYRTGDLARYLPDGRLEFLGRADHQVKLRGFRLELGEIEAALAEHAGVRSAVVVVRGDRLVAYVIAAKASDAPPPRVLRAHLAETLPAYMIPAAFVALEAFPETPNGKIDRKALPASGPAETEPSGAAPETDLEFALGALWRRLLGVAEVSVDDDFFALGGHSLLAVQLADAVESELGFPCTIGTVLQASTLRRLARELEAGGAYGAEPTVLELAAGVGPKLFCLVGVSCYQKLAQRLAPDFSVYGIFLPVEHEMFAGGRARRLSLEGLAAAYLSVIRREQPSGPYRLLGFCFGGLVAFEVAQQLQREGEEVADLIMLDTVPRGVNPPAVARLKERAKARVDRVCESLPAALQRVVRNEAWLTPAARLERARTRVYTHAEERYRQAPYPGRSIIVQPRESSSPRDYRLPDATWGWSRWTPDLVVCEVPGEHTTIFKEPHVDHLADALKTELTGGPYVPGPGARLSDTLMATPSPA